MSLTSAHSVIPTGPLPGRMGGGLLLELENEQNKSMAGAT